MTVRRPYRRTAAVAVLAVLVTAGGSGCAATHRALDCVRTANAAADAVIDLEQVTRTAILDPERADEILDALDDDIDKIRNRSDNASVDKAADDMDEAADNVRRSVENGDDHPDLSPLRDTAGELTKVCT